MLIGQTSSRWPRRRMLRASSPSSRASSAAAWSTRSLESLFLWPFVTVRCIVRCTADTGEVAVRRFVWIALAGQVLFVVSWIVGGALEPGYSHIEQGVSELGAH